MSSRESDLGSTKWDALPFPLRSDCCSIAPSSAATRAAASQRSQLDYSGIHEEVRWCERPQTDQCDPARILVSRWKQPSPHVHEHETEGDPDFAIVMIALQPAGLQLTLEGECLLDGAFAPGMVFMAPAGCPVRARIHGSCDFLHLYVPTARLDSIAQESASAAASDYFRRGRLWRERPAIERLAWLLLKAGDFNVASGAIYLDGIAQAILARLLHLGGEREGQRNQCLQTWRLKRVLRLIEEDLSRPLRLAELAECAGLSRMHFAAQFRESTGLQPHEFVVHRRIQRAQEILRTTDLPLAEVALVVGFQTQAHFTTVFRRLSGDTPGRWRQLQRLDDPTVRTTAMGGRSLS